MALEAAEKIAREAGQLLLRYAGRPLEVEEKGSTDLVTEADRAAEALILERIRMAFPEHNILSEESAPHSARLERGVQWIVDPLDGTTNFAHGVPIWAVSIACFVDGIPAAGVVLDPTRQECFKALRRGGAFLNGAPIRVSSCKRLAEALLVTGFPYDIQSDAVDNLDHFESFIKVSRAVRRLGSAALDLAYVACGRFDGFWELKLHAWDVAAGALLVEEAGGNVTDFEGGPFQPFGAEIAAANPVLLQAMNEILARGKRPQLTRGAAP
jgi:myo-inositol-1(or 4)-monophosphatase